MKAQGLWTEGADSDGDVSGQGSGVSVPPENAQPMSSSQFESLKAQVADQGMASGKIEVVEEAARSSYFSAAQVGELAALISMKGDRVTLVETVVDRILDLDNPAAITSKLTFADERADVESIMSKVQAARVTEEARLVEVARVAEEKRAAEAARAAEEQRVANEQQAASQNQSSSTSTNTTSSSSDSAYCCINGSYNSCDSAAAAGSCGGWGMCFFECQMDGAGNCEDKCTEKYPLIRQCRSEPSKDSLCKK